MAPSHDSVSEPIPISLIAGRYLLFDVNVVTYLRRTYHICGVLIGSIPQVPQQNVFLGLPVELLPEEVKVLVEKEVAYIVDDFAWHKQSFLGNDKQRYMESIRLQGISAKKTAEESARKRTEHALAKQAIQRARNESKNASKKPSSPDPSLNTTSLDTQSQDDTLFSDDPPTRTPSPTTLPAISSGFAVTPSTSYNPQSLPQSTPSQSLIVPLSYPLFAHLHSKDYFIMPGLRFGCDYNVYPGDPLRFHSHFLAVGLEWNREIPLLDLIGGGRLGTGVKKGYLIGGEDVEAEPIEGDKVRTFCIEWGGM